MHISARTDLLSLGSSQVPFAVHRCSWEVLSIALMETFENDLFVSMVNSADVYHERLGKTLTTFHMNMKNAMELESWALMSPSHDVYGRMHTVAKAILAILLPCPEGVGLSAKDALPLIDYKGSSALETSVAGAVQDTKFWRRLVDATNKTAGTSKEQYPLLHACLEEAKPAFNGGSGPDVWLKILSECLPKLEGIRSGLKAGASTELETILVKMIPAVAKYITSSKTIEEINTDQVDAFVLNLDLFDEDSLLAIRMEDQAAVFADLRSKLEHWRAKMSQGICTKKLETLIDDWLGAHEMGDAPEIDWNVFGQLIRACSDFSEDLGGKVSNCIYLMLRDLDEQAQLARVGKSI